jgi:hypothetical protein
MRSPEKEHFPEKVFCENNIIRAKFPQGIITDHLNQTTGELIVNREWELNSHEQLNFPFILTCQMEPSFYLIPGIVVNGNKYGKGKFPQSKLTEKHSFRKICAFLKEEI